MATHLTRPAPEIVVVDDDPAVSETICAILTDAGYRVEGFVDISAAYASIKATYPRLIIVDLLFPDSQHGADLITTLWMHETTSAIPIIVCSGATDQLATLGPHLARNGLTVLRKPFSIDTLLSVVARLLRRPVEELTPPA